MKGQLANSDKAVAQYSSRLKDLDFQIGTLEAQLKTLDPSKGSKNYDEWKHVNEQLSEAKRIKAETEANSKKEVMNNTKLKADVAKAADNLRAAETTQSTVEAENKTNIENANANVAAAEDAAAEVKQQVSDGISLAKEQVDNMNASLDKATEAFKNAEASGASFADKANILNQKIDIAENQLLPELNTESNNALKVKLATPTITNPPAAESAQPSVQALGQQSTGKDLGSDSIRKEIKESEVDQKAYNSGKMSQKDTIDSWNNRGQDAINRIINAQNGDMVYSKANEQELKDVLRRLNVVITGNPNYFKNMDATKQAQMDKAVAARDEIQSFLGAHKPGDEIKKTDNQKEA